MARVVSLVPSVTETLLTWGIEPVGVTRFCEQPALPAVGGTKDPDIAAIAGLRPDLVVVNDEENRREDADALAAAGLDVHVVTVRRVEDVGPAFGALAAKLGVDGGVADPPPVSRPPAGSVRVFVPIWRRPWMTLNGDTYGSALLSWCGGVNVFAADGDRYPVLGGLAEVAGLRPHLVVAPSEPYPFAERHRAELATIAPVLFVDGRDLFWWGARTAGAVTRLAGQVAAAAGR